MLRMKKKHEEHRRKNVMRREEQRRRNVKSKRGRTWRAQKGGRDPEGQSKGTTRYMRSLPFHIQTMVPHEGET